jgi:alkylation response protein AidB-like acyl-CoA dehydrogenase
MDMPTADDVRAEVEAFLDEKWDPDLSVAEWWARLARSGYAAPMLPPVWGGMGWGRDLANVVSATLSAHRALGPPAGIGLMLAAPTIVAHGTDEQKRRFVARILDGQDGWCQLFSEPGAGSDLAGLQTRAVRDGDEWIVTGQKVWTSTAQHADWGMLLARTDPDLPKHKGITWFAFPMHQPGVEVRPLREMTGRAIFNEVFMDEARVSHANIIGGLNDGWAVANTTLMVERAGIGGGGGGMGGAVAGSVAGHLERRAGDFVAKTGDAGAGRIGTGTARRLIELAQQHGRSSEAVVRQQLVRLYTLTEVNRMSLLRARAANGRTGAEGNIAKLMMAEQIRLAREVGNLILGAGGMLTGPGAPSGGLVQEITVSSPGPSIYGGTDQVQRNIIGERVLGLPKEPGPSKDTPFRDLVVGTQRA